MRNNNNDRFITDFYCADENYDNYQESLDHFLNAFVHPKEFDALRESILPERDTKKIVLVDGHPRSGKTWSVAYAVRDIIAKSDWQLEDYWSSGVDSLKVFPNSGCPLLEGCRNTLAQLGGKKKKKLILLDDFLGTNTLRRVPAQSEVAECARLFEWTSTNPIVSAMEESSTLVITGRSLFFTLSELFLGLDIRPDGPSYEIKKDGIRVLLFRSGLFRTLGTNDLFGSFGPAQFAEVVSKNLQFHPLSSDRDWLLRDAPILAMGAKDITSKEETTAARVIFGDDLDTLAELIENRERDLSKFSKEALEDTELTHLDLLYAVCIAPGLLFVGPNAYASLGLGEKRARDILSDLYLFESSEEFRSGRLPNEFYMRAVDIHLDVSLPVTSRAYRRIMLRNKGKFTDMRLAIRGLIERGLEKEEAKKPNDIRNALESGDWLTDIKEYQEDSFDPLLHIELEGAKLNYSEHLSLTDYKRQFQPGLLAAIGWVLYKFFSSGPGERLTVQKKVFDWLKDRFGNLLTEIAEDIGLDSETSEQFSLKWHEAVAIYSTVLQWTIEMGARQKSVGRSINDLSKVAETNLPSSDLRVLLEHIILIDELIWGCLEKGYALSHMNVDALLRAVFKSPELQPFTEELRPRLIVNFVFSASWHNSWLNEALRLEELTENYKKDHTRFMEVIEWVKLRELAANWMEHAWPQARDLAKRNPNLILDNLQYHWYHFITQYAQWMRNWCFEDNPIAFENERSQVARGSERPEDNNNLLELLSIVLADPDVSADHFRNCVFMICTRSPSLSDGQVDDMIALFERRLEVAESSQKNKEVTCFWSAIFELSRQGFLDDPVAGVETARCSESLRNWCRTKAEALSEYREQSWRHYYEELCNFSHELDLLPKRIGGWDDIKPAGWH